MDRIQVHQILGRIVNFFPQVVMQGTYWGDSSEINVTPSLKMLFIYYHIRRKLIAQLGKRFFNIVQSMKINPFSHEFRFS